MLSRAWALYSTPNWFGTVSSRVSAAAMASSAASGLTSASGSAAYERPKIARVFASM